MVRLSALHIASNVRHLLADGLPVNGTTDSDGLLVNDTAKSVGLCRTHHRIWQPMVNVTTQSDSTNLADRKNRIQSVEQVLMVQRQGDRPAATTSSYSGPAPPRAERCGSASGRLAGESICSRLPSRCSPRTTEQLPLFCLPFREECRKDDRIAPPGGGREDEREGAVPARLESALSLCLSFLLYIFPCAIVHWQPRDGGWGKPHHDDRAPYGSRVAFRRNVGRVRDL